MKKTRWLAGLLSGLMVMTISVSGVAFAADGDSPYVKQGEDAEIAEGVVFGNQHGRFRGTGYMDFNQGPNTYLEMEFDLPQDGEAVFYVRYSQGFNYQKFYTLKLNDQLLEERNFICTQGWDSWTTVNVTGKVKKGINKFRITQVYPEKVGICVDEVEVYYKDADGQLFRPEVETNEPTPAPATPAPAPATPAPVVDMDHPTVILNGNTVTFPDNVQATIVDDRTLIPVRGLFESLGAEVGWEEATETVTITKGETVIVMQLNNPVATVNGTEVTLDVPPYTINDRTMVPLRFIAESLNAEVGWDEATATVTITTAV